MPTPPTPDSGSGLSKNARIAMGLVLVAIVVSVMAVAVVISRGVANLTVIDSLDQGECVESHFPTAADAADGEFFSVLFVTRIDCAQPHAYEVYALTDSLWTEDSVFPGVDGLFETADGYCREQFELFTNSEYATSPYDFFTFVPTADVWEGGGREVRCLIGRSDGVSLTTGSLAGSGARTIS